LKHKRWQIFSQPHPDGIEVMRVVDSVRDLLRYLRDEYSLEGARTRTLKIKSRAEG
jgi:hypothetical protein